MGARCRASWTAVLVAGFLALAAPCVAAQSPTSPGARERTAAAWRSDGEFLAALRSWLFAGLQRAESALTLRAGAATAKPGTGDRRGKPYKPR